MNFGIFLSIKKIEPYGSKKYTMTETRFPKKCVRKSILLRTIIKPKILIVFLFAKVQKTLYEYSLILYTFTNTYDIISLEKIPSKTSIYKK